MNKASGGDGIPAELFQSLKDDAVKVLHSICQQIWKAQQWPQDWKSQFSFQSQRRAMPKNVQTMVQLCSFHMLTKLYSKYFKLGFTSMWTENFQMSKLGLEKAEEPEIELPTFLGSALLWAGMKLTFCSPVVTAEFSKFAGILSTALSQHHL